MGRIKQSGRPSSGSKDAGRIQTEYVPLSMRNGTWMPAEANTDNALHCSPLTDAPQIQTEILTQLGDANQIQTEIGKRPDPEHREHAISNNAKPGDTCWAYLRMAPGIFVPIRELPVQEQNVVSSVSSQQPADVDSDDTFAYDIEEHDIEDQPPLPQPSPVAVPPSASPTKATKRTKVSVTLEQLQSMPEHEMSRSQKALRNREFRKTQTSAASVLEPSPVPVPPAASPSQRPMEATNRKKRVRKWFCGYSDEYTRWQMQCRSTSTKPAPKLQPAIGGACIRR